MVNWIKIINVLRKKSYIKYFYGLKSILITNYNHGKTWLNDYDVDNTIANCFISF